MTRQARWAARTMLAGFVLLLVGSMLSAHPIPQKQHDRTIVVRVLQDPAQAQLRLRVEYRLEVDEFTVVFIDLPKLTTPEERNKFQDQEGVYGTYVRNLAPILAANLSAGIQGEAVDFNCTKSSYTLNDEQGNKLGHLRCDFVFESQPIPFPAQDQTRLPIKIRERNFELEQGRIRLSLAADASLTLADLVESDEALQNKPFADWKPGDETKLRSAAATIERTLAPVKAEAAPTETAPTKTEDGPSDSLLRLLLDSRQGFAMLLLLAAVFGAAHALTPGHGKTLVAAYLVGERGTAWHAVLLGIVTTITHTGAVLLIAALLPIFFPDAPPRDIEMALKLGGGLLITGLGLWLLLRRLAGGADHVHLPGTGHHHHHGPGGHTHAVPASVSTWGLIVLGISGGIIPCWDAIVMLGLAISAQRLWLGLPLLLAFSAGLAGVLVAIGLAVVYLKGFASSAFGESKLVRLLPLVSALLVTVLGFWLCYDGVHGTPPSTLPSP